MTTEEALEKLAVLESYDPGNGPGPCVHTIRQVGAGPLLGAHWYLTQAREVIQEHGVEEAGPDATRSGHGLVTIDNHGAIFWATKESNS